VFVPATQDAEPPGQLSHQVAAGLCVRHADGRPGPHGEATPEGNPTHLHHYSLTYLVPPRAEEIIALAPSYTAT
jgi:hypothetical protein